MSRSNPPVGSNGQGSTGRCNGPNLRPALRFCMGRQPVLHFMRFNLSFYANTQVLQLLCKGPAMLQASEIGTCLSCETFSKLKTSNCSGRMEGQPGGYLALGLTCIWAAVKCAAPGGPLRLPLLEACCAWLALPRLTKSSPFWKAAISASVGGKRCSKQNLSQ